MRRVRSKLQVSTFPFLAVLLAAIGALIFLLLVMDRRSKIVARNKGREALEARRESQRQEAAKKEALRLATLEASEEEQRRLRQALEAHLVDQKNAVHAELAKVHADLAGASTVLKKEEAEAMRLLREQEILRLALSEASKDLEGKRLARTLTKEQEEHARAAVTRMAVELAGLEKLLKDLQSRPKRDNVFSLVPYRGKHGENRKPIYVECDGRGLIFPTAGRSLSLLELDPETIRKEIQKAGLVLALKKETPADSIPPLSSTDPYVLCLVRPDGIGSYDRLQNALQGYAIDFGYELVDASWVIDYSAEGVPGLEEPLPKLAERKTGKELPPLPGTVSGEGGKTPGTFGPLAGGGPSVGPGGSGLPRPGVPGTGTLGKGFPPGGGEPGPGLSGESGLPRPGAPGTGTLGKGYPGVDSPAIGEPGLSGPGLPGSIPGLPVPGKTPGLPPLPGAEGTGKGPLAKGGRPGVGTPGETKKEGDVPWRGSKTGDGSEKPGGSPGGGEPSGPGPRFLEPMAKSAPRPASLGHMLSNREYLIVVVCKETEAVLQGVGLRFGLDGSPAEQDKNAQALRDTVRNLIGRRQASLRPGEPPYRPLIRFQVHPAGLRTFYRVYPALVELSVPLQRENVE